MEKYLLGIDIGGTETKSCIFDSGGNLVGTAGVSVPVEIPAPDHVERDAGTVWSAVCQTVRSALQDAGISPDRIACIGLTGYGNGTLLADSDGNAIGKAIVSTDNRGQKTVLEARRSGLEEKAFALSHQGLWSAQTCTLLMWLNENRREDVDRARWFLGIKEYIRMKLTGMPCCEITEASSTGLMNIRTRSFDLELFRLLGIENCFRLAPPCVDCSEPLGSVTEEAAALTGLAAGTPVTGAIFDVDAGLLGSGILDGDTLCMIAGTWSINEYLSDDISYGYGETTNSVSCSFLEGRYLIEESTPTSASNFSWFLDQFMRPFLPDLSPGELYDRCNEMVASTDPEDSQVVFIPYLYASATHPDAKAGFLNVSGYTTMAHMVRAVYEGVVFSSLFNIRRLMARGKKFSRARLSGGLTNSPVWTQMMADATGIPIEVPDGSELSALGVCIAAGVGCGLYRDYADGVEKTVRVLRTYLPDASRTEIYRIKYARYEKALEALDVFYG